MRGGFFVFTAAATALLYVILRFALGIDIVISTAIAVLFGFAFRILSQFLGWEEWEPSEPEELKAGEKPHPTLGVEIRKELDKRDGNLDADQDEKHAERNVDVAAVTR